MDAIDRAIEKGKHLTDDPVIKGQTWEDFNKDVKDKHLYIFGAGNGAEFLWQRSRRKVEISGVVDNDPNKQGIKADRFIWCESVMEEDFPRICSPTEFKSADPDKSVVLVNSINHYKEIVIQLRDLGFYNLYVLLIMEAEYRANTGWEGAGRDDVLKQYMNLPVDKDKLCFVSYKYYSGHGKYISDCLLAKGYQGTIVWILSDTGVKQEFKGIQSVSQTNTKRVIYELETAGIILYDTLLPEYVKKRDGQVHIHMKHWASITLKRFYLDSETITDNPDDVKRWRDCFKELDYVLTGSEFDEESVRRGFSFSGEMVRVGSPRSDTMFHEKENKKKVAEYYERSPEEKLVLYAPTYRYKKSTDANEHIAEMRDMELDFDLLCDCLKLRFGGEWTILFRLHPAVARTADRYSFSDHMINASDYPDSEELSSACDIMITDYSSIMFEPAFAGKPVFLFAPDRDEYIDKEYDLLIEYDTLPFSIAETQDQLHESIMHFCEKEYKISVKTFLDKYNVHEDGHASERAADFIMQLLNKDIREYNQRKR